MATRTWDNAVSSFADCPRHSGDTENGNADVADDADDGDDGDTDDDGDVKIKIKRMKHSIKKRLTNSKAGRPHSTALSEEEEEESRWGGGG